MGRDWHGSCAAERAWWPRAAPALRVVSEPLGPVNCLMASLFMLLTTQVVKVFGFPMTES